MLGSPATVELEADADSPAVSADDAEVHATTGGAAAAGAITGGVIGLVGGPLGAAVGAVGGAIVGALTERSLHNEPDLEPLVEDEAAYAIPTQH